MKRPILTILMATVLVAVYIHSTWTLLNPRVLFPCSTAGDNYPLNSVVDDGRSLYESALATLRCLATPNCFPSSQCRVGVPQKIQRKKYWEEHSLCLDELQKKKDCLVYSFGIHVSSEWEEKMAKFLHCEVHAFDPTMDHPTDLAPGVTFHKLGLQAEGTDMSTTHASEYGVIDPDLLLTLSEIMEELDHVGRKLDVLALDCEGCEWGVLEQLACSGESTLVDQLFVEFHFQKDLGLATPNDVVHAARGIQCLWHHRWHIVAIESSGAYWKNWEYTTGMTQVIHGEGFLLYLSLQRFAVDEPMPSDRLAESIVATQAYHETMSRYKEEYETKEKEEWPQEAQDFMRKRTTAYSQARRNKQRIQRTPEVQFDTYSRFEEPVQETG